MANNRNPYFAEDYTWLRDQGVSNREIAAQMGVEFESLRRRCARNECWIPDRCEEVLTARLEALIAAGQPFTIAHLNARDEWRLATGLISKAFMSGQVRAIGRRGNSNTSYVWVRADPLDIERGVAA